MNETPQPASSEAFSFSLRRYKMWMDVAGRFPSSSQSVGGIAERVSRTCFVSFHANLRVSRDGSSGRCALCVVWLSFRAFESPSFSTRSAPFARMRLLLEPCASCAPAFCWPYCGTNFSQVPGCCHFVYIRRVVAVGGWRLAGTHKQASFKFVRRQPILTPSYHVGCVPVKRRNPVGILGFSCAYGILLSWLSKGYP